MTRPGGCLAVILGASEWPYYPGFETRPAFQNTANFFRDYVMREEGIGLPPENLLWLFDDDSQPGLIIEKMAKFLRERAANPSISDIFVFYVGHGGYLNKDYFVALRCTSQNNRELTSLPVRFIAKTLNEETPDKRHIVIIDACYASGAVKDFIYQDASVAVADVRQQVREVLPELNINTGSALFCSAGPKTKAKAPWEGEYTMFSGALHRVLYTGDPALEEYLSLEEVAELVERDIFNTFRAEAVRPELHTPKQEKGDIRFLRLFPNLARRKELESRTTRALRADLDELTGSVRGLSKAFDEAKTLLASVVAKQDESFRQMRNEMSDLLKAKTVEILPHEDVQSASLWSIDDEELMKRKVTMEHARDNLMADKAFRYYSQIYSDATLSRMIIVGSIIFQIGLLALSLALDRFGAVSIFVVIWILRGSLVLGCAVAVFLLSSIILTRSPSPPPQSTVAIDPLQELRDLRRGFDMLSRAAEHGGGKAVAETTNALPNKPSQRQLVHLECMQNIREIDREIYKLTRATDYADYSIYGWMFRIDFRLGLFVSLALTGIATLFLLLSPLPLAA